jgi:hypothetical protein
MAAIISDGFRPPQRLHEEELLRFLEIGQLVRSHQPLFDVVVDGLCGRRLHQVRD